MHANPTPSRPVLDDSLKALIGDLGFAGGATAVDLGGTMSLNLHLPGEGMAYHEPRRSRGFPENV